LAFLFAQHHFVIAPARKKSRKIATFVKKDKEIEHNGGF